MTTLSVQNRNTKSTNYMLLTLLEGAKVEFKAGNDSSNIIHLGCNRYQILLGEGVEIAISNTKGDAVFGGLVDELLMVNADGVDIKGKFEDGFILTNSSEKVLFKFMRI